jgi:hypothetical protein
MIDLEKIVGFEWDKGNARKSADKHGVTQIEAEQVFDDQNVLFLKDIRHSEKEPRYQALGKTKKDRFLIVTFTMRRDDTFVRVISAREMSRKERGCYD